MIGGEKHSKAGDDHQRGCCRYPGVDVGIARPVNEAGRLDEIFGTIHPRAEGQRREEQRGEDRQVPSRAPRHHHGRGKPRREVAGYQIDSADGERREDDERLGEPVDELQERQREDIERDVVAQDRIGLAERNRIAPCTLTRAGSIPS